jgi:hypothetical protein
MMSKTVKFSPLDVYKIFSSIIFLGIGSFFVYQGVSKKGYMTWLSFGLIILAYGLFRVWVAYRLIRNIRKSQQQPSDQS